MVRNYIFSKTDNGLATIFPFCLNVLILDIYFFITLIVHFKLLIRRPDQPKKKSTNSIQNIRKEESIKKKQKQSKLDKEHHINQKQNKQKINEFCVDMWVENGKFILILYISFCKKKIIFLELEEKCAPSKSAAETQIKYKKHEKIHLRKKLPIPSIEYPHPGTSYNPSYEDHVDLLNQIAEKEKMIIKEEKHLNRVTRSMFRKVTEAERDVII